MLDARLQFSPGWEKGERRIESHSKYLQISKYSLTLSQGNKITYFYDCEIVVDNLDVFLMRINAFWKTGQVTNSILFFEEKIVL